MMSDWKYKLYGSLQYFYHNLKGRNIGSEYIVFYTYDLEDDSLLNKMQGCYINGQLLAKTKNTDIKKYFFKGDNILYVEGRKFDTEGCKGHDVDLNENDRICDKWLKCIQSAKVEDGWKNSGFYLTAYIKEKKQWCLSNWIWTSAPIARLLSDIGYKKDSQDIADVFMREQLEEGGWVVRYDFIDGRLNRLEAPNDSAYIARNALLTAYKDSGDTQYIDRAKKCAKWIIDTSCNDGLVLFGYNIDKKKWIKDRNIVDIGFTAGLFSELYELTGDYKYKEFLDDFIEAFINTFYDRNAKMFSSHINGKRKRNGGYFSRGQGWAMEGLIDAYLVNREKYIYEILESLTLEVANKQLPNGGWYCNLQKARSMMGEDCKGVSCIAKSLLIWAEYSKNRDLLICAGKKAYEWCKNHTDKNTGLILSFSCNGAIAHSKNTSTGMLYANAYALEVERLLQGYGEIND